MPVLSDYARGQKVKWFLEPVPKAARILEIGCGDGWFARYAREHGWRNYATLDLLSPADYVGGVSSWRTLGLQPESFDVIIAFEVVEHVPCFQECHELLTPGGLLFLTSPLPSMDWLCRLLECVGLNQKRTSPHLHLIDFRKIPFFECVELRIVAGIAQWGKFRKGTTEGSKAF